MSPMRHERKEPTPMQLTVGTHCDYNDGVMEQMSSYTWRDLVLYVFYSLGPAGTTCDELAYLGGG
jgi:hypothetical protein